MTFTVTDALGLSDQRRLQNHYRASACYLEDELEFGICGQSGVGKENGAGINAIDGYSTTRWHTKWYGGADPLPMRYR
ncbi:MAG: hypothetical protein HS127_09330 [Planctomycetia bacterium]|nr:hypothetical protein [Planctomycetia bacterium]